MTRLRRLPVLDGALAGGLSVLGVAQLLFEDAGPVAVVLMLGITLPVALRRVAPLPAVAASWFVIFLEGGFGADVTSQGYAAILALWITVYSVARHGRGRQPLAGLVWALACVIGSVVTTSGLDLPSMMLTTVITVGPWLAGYVVRREVSGRARAEDDAELARAESDRHAREAVADERSRIAREVHDVLGHTLGLMVLQLGAADQAMDTDPDRAREAVRSARRSGKSALAEVRYLIGLHGNQIGAAEPPTRGLQDIPDLVEQNRGAGVDVELELDLGAGPGSEAAVADPAPSATDLAAYRIVQESLTNALRHGSQWRTADDGSGWSRGGTADAALLAARDTPSFREGGRMTTVVIVDDQALVRAGLRMILDQAPTVEVVGEAADGRQALDLVARTRPEVALMDIRMPVLDGIEATRRIAGTDIGTRVLMLTTFGEDSQVVEAMRAGASGFLLKDVDPPELVHAITVIARGDALLAPAIVRRLIERFTAVPARSPAVLAALTDREREILIHLTRGLSNDEIATGLFISPATVKTHVTRILAKLGLRDRTQAVVFGYESGLVRPGEPTADESGR